MAVCRALPTIVTRMPAHQAGHDPFMCASSEADIDMERLRLWGAREKTASETMVRRQRARLSLRTGGSIPYSDRP